MNFKKVITSAAVLSVMAFSAAVPVTKNGATLFPTTTITANAAKQATTKDVDNFLNKYNGRGIDVDGIAGVQCVDLISKYMSEVFGISQSTLNAREYWTQFNNYSFLKNNFTKISNTPDFVPKKGDIVVWTNGTWGHVAIATGEGTTSYFYSYDQNYSYAHSPTTKTRHNYTGVAGVLRPKALVSNSGGSTEKAYALGTVWVEGDTYIFNKAQTMYKDKACKTSAGPIKVNQKKVFTEFYKTSDGKSTIGKTSDGYYIYVRKNNELNVNAYVTVDVDVLNVRSGAGTNYSIVTTMKRNKTVRVSKYSGNWAYSPDVKGWFSLEYVRG